MPGEQLVERVVRLTADLERVPDPGARRLAEDLSAAVLELHTEGLERLLGLLDEDERWRAAQDPVIGGLLLVHGLHPESLENRVREGLDQVRPYMASHGGDVELLGIEEGVVRLRLVGSCDGCAASASTLELAVEKALEETAPDLVGMEVEGAVATLAAVHVTGTELPMVPPGNGNGRSGDGSLDGASPGDGSLGGASDGNGAVGGAPRGLGDWLALDGLDDVAVDELRSIRAAEEQLVVARVDGSLLAYRDLCVACGMPLNGGALSAGVLSCPSCARRYFLPRAGRSLDDEQIQLQPIPLLVERGNGVKVALPT
jgi:Fe-S cluster biogenesis protein NfuA/nitrite reductase/ring-hydroxylating ferredoxin subunit